MYCVSRLLYWAYPEYILGTSCAHPGHIWKKYKTYLEHCALNSGHASGVPWPYIGYILVVFWAYTVNILGIYQEYIGYILGIYWAYTRNILGIYQEYIGHILEIYWAYMGIYWAFIELILQISVTYLVNTWDINQAYIRHLQVLY